MQDTLSTLDTPAAVIDLARMHTNITRMQQRMDALGVRLRPHVKTSKSLPVAAAQRAAGAAGITVSTLKEAGQFFAAGSTDILYAVSMAPHRLPQALDLCRRGCDLKLIVDSVAAAEAVATFGREHGEAFEVWIEMDTDGHRSGVPAGDAPLLLAIGRALHSGGMRLGGVLTHAGSSYELDTPRLCRHWPSASAPAACRPPRRCARPAFRAPGSAWVPPPRHWPRSGWTA